MEETEPISGPEKFAGAVDSFRDWIIKTWRIGLLMAKGGYIVGERKRLFVKLGEEVYYKIAKGEIRHVELEPIVQQLDRLTKKVEIEEILVRNLRFGKRQDPEKKKRNKNPSQEKKTQEKEDKK